MASPSSIASIVNLSRKTFRRCPASKRFLLGMEEFAEHKQELGRKLQRLGAEDLGLDKSAFLHGVRTASHSPHSQLSQKSQQQGSLGDVTHSTESSSSSLSSSSSTSSVYAPRRRGRSPSSYPLCYVSIFEDEDVTVGVFMIRPGRAIPLHNHPGMHGILKCVAGTCDILAYSDLDEDKGHKIQCPSYFTEGQRLLAAEGEIFPVSKTVMRGIDAKSGPCTLTPTEHNYHEIKATSSTPVAFLDILAPPYSSEDTTLDIDNIRECTYFSEIHPCFSSSSSEEEMEDGEEASSRVTFAWLEETPPPQNYDMISEPYTGPRVVQTY